MKRFSIRMAFALLVSVLAPAAFAQPQTQTPKFKTEEEQKAYEVFYNAQYVQKDLVKAYDLAKVFVERYPDSEVAPYAKSSIINKVGNDFQAALMAFYADNPPVLAKLDKLISVGEEYLRWQPEQPYVSSHMGLASSRAALAGTLKDLNRAKVLAEKALKLMESPTPPANYPKEQYDPLRENVIISANQYLGYYELEQPNPNLDAAIAFLTKSMQMKNKDGLGWKDPNNYWFRASAYQKRYGTLSAQYRGLTDEQKSAEQGKAILDQINPLIDKMIDDYARVVAVAAANEAAKELMAAAKESLDSFWKYRYSNLANGQNDLVKHFQADPTVEAPARTPAASSPDLSAGAPPTATSSKPTLSAAPATANGSKTGSSKSKGKTTKAAPKKKGKKK